LTLFVALLVDLPEITSLRVSARKNRVPMRADSSVITVTNH
jgi:hypothetical protein